MQLLNIKSVDTYQFYRALTLLFNTEGDYENLIEPVENAFDLANRYHSDKYPFHVIFSETFKRATYLYDVIPLGELELVSKMYDPIHLLAPFKPYWEYEVQEGKVYWQEHETERMRRDGMTPQEKWADDARQHEEYRQEIKLSTGKYPEEFEAERRRRKKEEEKVLDAYWAMTEIERLIVMDVMNRSYERKAALGLEPKRYPLYSEDEENGLPF